MLRQNSVLGADCGHQSGGYTDAGKTMTPLEAILSFLIGLAANGTTAVAQERWQRRLDEVQADEDALRQALSSRRSLREEVRAACAELARNRDRLGVTPQEVPLWHLLNDEVFQNDVAEWLMAGDIAEGEAVRASLVGSMTRALSGAGASGQAIEFLKTQYFEALNRAVFSNPILAHWRHQLSLDYLREQVAFLRKKAEEDAGIYSPEKQRAALDRYCENALRAWDIIDLSNLPEGDVHIATQKLLLRQLYVPLRIQVEVSSEQGGDEAALAQLEERREWRRRWETGRVEPGESPARDQSELFSVGDRLSVARRLVVLGDPGGGKTTMMRWMATAYLLRYRDDPAHREIPDAEKLPDRRWIPVLIRCRDLGETDLCRCFTDFLTQHLHKTELLPGEADVMRAVILDSVAKGEALLLVDGLDEVTDPQVRMMFCQELERTAVRYPEAHIVVTSRIVGYRDMPYRMGTGFEHGLIAELTRDDKDLFARRWVEVTEQHQPAAEKEKRAQDLIDALHSSDRVERLTGNPMLLTTLALVKRKVGKLPSRRTKLYAEAVSVLLNWNPRYYEIIDENEAIPQLEFLAYQMCRKGVQRLTEDEVLDLLDMARQEYPNIRAIRRREPHVFLELLEARSSILIKAGGYWLKQGKEKPVWEFRHLTFQEYLAARALLDGRYPGRDREKTLAEQVAPLAGTVKEARLLRASREPEMEFAESWQETFRLLVADCRDDEVDDVLRAIATPMPGEDRAKTARPRAVLAARCLADEPNVSEQLAEELLVGLAKQVSEADGMGFPSTGLDATALELGKCLWAPLLKKCLVQEYLCRDPADRWRVGSLWGMVEVSTAPRDKQTFARWFGSFPERLGSGDEIEVTAAALAVMAAAYEGAALAVPGLVDSLLGLLSRSGPLRDAAAWALGWLSRRSPIRRGAKPVWQPKGDEVQALVMALDSVQPEEESTNRWLIGALGSSNDPRATEPLIGKLDAPDSRVQFAVIEALGELRDQRAVAPLIGQLDAPDSRVRFAVISALGELGAQEAVAPLIGKLEDQDSDVRVAAIEALGELGGQQAVAPLIGKLEDPNADARVSAAKALGRLEDPRGPAALAQFLRSTELSLRRAAVGALAQERDPVEQRLLSRDLDGISPWLDPQEPITEDGVDQASRRLYISPEAVRSRYESMADDLNLKLSWREKPPSAS